MYKKIKILSCVTAALFFFVWSGCGGSLSSTPTPTPTTPTIPTISSIRAALGANNTYGMVPGLALGEIVLPVCTDEDGSEITSGITYSVSGLPDWLSFDATTRAITLASGDTVPSGAYTAAEITYSCAVDAETSISASTSTPEAFTINDLDGGGVVDGREYEYGEVPLLSPLSWFQLNPGNLDMYRIGTSSFGIPTGVIKMTSGMDPTDADDDTADFDGDDGVTGGGTNDVEISNGTNPMVYATSGTLTVASEVAIGSIGAFLVSADFNGDGNLDIAASGYTTSDTISVFLGNGDGTFTAFDTTATTGTEPFTIITADFNGNGNSDLAVNNTGDGTLSILLGQGDGTFVDSGEKPSSKAGLAFPSTSDFNGDGILDIAVTGETTVLVYLGDGDGTFDIGGVITVTLPAESSIQGITPADFNDDGIIDLAASNGNDNDQLLILIGAGDGTFEVQSDKPSTGVGPGLIVATDFDGDGVVDLAVANFNGGAGNTLTFLLGNGDGTFSEASGSPLTTEVSPLILTAADLTGDGFVDISVSHLFGETVSIFLGNGDGTFTSAPGSPINMGSNPYCLVAADFDGDGDIDLVSSQPGSNLSTLLNQ